MVTADSSWTSACRLGAERHRAHTRREAEQRLPVVADGNALGAHPRREELRRRRRGIGTVIDWLAAWIVEPLERDLNAAVEPEPLKVGLTLVDHRNDGAVLNTDVAGLGEHIAHRLAVIVEAALMLLDEKVLISAQRSPVDIVIQPRSPCDTKAGVP